MDNAGIDPHLSSLEDFFLGADDVTASGPVIQAYGSDSSRALSIRGPVRIVGPTVRVGAGAREFRLWCLSGRYLRLTFGLDKEPLANNGPGA
jgi:hypothetical protein